MIVSLLFAQSDSESAGTDIYHVIVIMLLFLYFLPTIVGAIRKVPNVVSVFVVNFFFGWSLIGWVVALAMAARTAPPPGYPPVSGYPPPSPPPWPPSGSPTADR
ncbi:MAG: superinfection immunity protein [Pseudonocardiaceae bacterium]